MTNLNATLSHIQGNILITLDGPDGLVAEGITVQPPLLAALEAGILPGHIENVLGSRDTVQVFLAQTGCGCDPQLAETKLTAKAIKAVLNTAGIETVLDDTFDRAARYDEHRNNFLETAAEEISVETN